MIEKDLVIVGGGPAGLAAANIACAAGVSVALFERNFALGGQLIKQTHKFFGSEAQYAQIRGIEIAKLLINDLKKTNIELFLNAVVVGLYPDNILTVYQNNRYFKVKAKAIIIATGASEKFLAFENNDLPGIYGAGAIQTLMNIHGVLPGKEVVMVGSGNIGLIVSYQLIQAGIKVKALLEAASSIGGYLVHASKLKRLGVALKMNTTIKKAFGKEHLEKITTVKLDDNWQEIPGSEEEIVCDCLCIAVGLSPLHQLLSMAGAKMTYINELGGLVPFKNNNYESSIKAIYVAGDVTGIEEASSAIVEGKIAGLFASKDLGFIHPNFSELEKELRNELCNLRQGPCGKKIREGLEKVGGLI